MTNWLRRQLRLITEMAPWDEPLEISLEIYNKLNSLNSTKDSLCGRQASPRDTQLNSSKGGQIEQAGEEGKGKCWAWSWATGRRMELGAPCIPVEGERKTKTASTNIMAHSPA